MPCPHFHGRAAIVSKTFLFATLLTLENTHFVRGAKGGAVNIADRFRGRLTV